MRAGQMRTVRDLGMWSRDNVRQGGTQSRRIGALLVGVLLTVAALLVVSASAEAAQVWRAKALANSTASPGDAYEMQFQADNIGDAPMTSAPEDPHTVTVELADGLTVSDPTLNGAVLRNRLPASSTLCTRPDGSPLQLGDSVVRCSSGVALQPTYGANAFQRVHLSTELDESAAEGSVLVSTVTVEGGGAAAASAPLRTRVADMSPQFGLAEVDGLTGDGLGGVESQAGASPDDISVQIDFETADGPHGFDGPAFPVEPVKSVITDLPPGFVGAPSALETCTAGELINASGPLQVIPLCPSASQVGTTNIDHWVPTPTLTSHVSEGPIPVFNMVPPHDAAARFGFNFAGSIVLLDAVVRSDGDFGLTVSANNVPGALALPRADVTFWGAPASAEHDLDRACPGRQAPSEPSGINALNPGCIDAEGNALYERPDVTAFLRNPTSCTAPGEGLETKVHVSSWANPGSVNADGTPDLSDDAWKSAGFESHEPHTFSPYAPGDPVGTEGCHQVPFNPQVTIVTTSSAADTPTGLDFRIDVPQTSSPEVLGSSDVKDVAVTLPEGFTMNPGAADGLESCSLSEVDLEGRNTKAGCPGASKVGSVRIDTPLLTEDLTGSVYLAEQNDPGKPGAENPFDSLIAIYIVAKGPGTVLKLPGKVDLDPETGQIVNTFKNQPQLPFNTLEVSFFDGPRSPIATPKSCGSGQASSELTPWARPGEPVVRTANLQITRGPNGQPCSATEASRPFEPKLSAGTVSAKANGFSPFTMKLTRPAGHQELKALSVALPPGLTSKLAGVDQCSDATLASISQAEGSAADEVAAPKCPAGSRVGKAIVGVGAGVPHYVQTGKVYLAGPYKGAPLSLAVVVPALAGPFDLGTTVVRNKVEVDPRTAQITVGSDPLPQILSGIPLRIQDLRIRVDRDQFMLAPTNCDPMSIGATVKGSHGASANLTNHFQVSGCGDLGFSPKLKLSFGKAKKNTKPNAHPPLNAKLAFNEGDSNISRVEVALPQGLLLDQERLGRICSRANYAANTCPEESRVGYAKATTPLLDAPVEGPVYLKASDNPLPDLAADLNGQIDIDLFGRIDQKQNKKGLNQIRNTFDVVPDVPVGSFRLTLDGGSDGLLVNSRNICKSKSARKVSIEMAAHNEMSLTEKPLIGSACKSKAKKKPKGKKKKKGKRKNKKNRRR